MLVKRRSRLVIEEYVVTNSLDRESKKQAADGISVYKDHFRIKVTYCEAGEVIGLFDADKCAASDVYMIYSIMVKQNRRREGIATAMFDAACEVADVRHSRNLTELGALWATSVGHDC